MTDAWSASLIALALAGGPAAALTARFGHRDPGRATGQAARVLAVAAGAAVASALLALLGRQATLPGIDAGPFPSLVLVLVLGMGATVLGYAGRSLRHEPYQRRFAVAGSVLVGLGALLATTTDLVILAAAWVAASAATLRLLATGPDQGTAARMVRARRALLGGDGLVVVAVALLVASTGSTAIDDLTGSTGPGVVLAGLLLVVAAAARGATAPFHRWLPDSLGAPTPSSALLHAGVVNGGAIVLLKLAPATTAQWPVATLALVLGAASCVFAEAVMLTRPDVKGRLAWSTVAQMSFTLALCGLGLHTAAALHLVAHGFYKGALFLGSGSNVRALVRERTAPPSSRPASRALTPVAFGLSGLSVAGAFALMTPEPTGNLLVPVGLAWVAAGCAIAVWFQRTPALGQRLAGGLGMGGLLVAFVATTVVVKDEMAPTIEASAALHPAWVLALLAALAAVALSRDAAERTPLLGHAWARVRAAGRPRGAEPLRVPRLAARPRALGWSEGLTPSLSPALDDGFGRG